MAIREKHKVQAAQCGDERVKPYTEVTPQSDVSRLRGVTMGDDCREKPPAPDLPAYVREPLEKQSPDRLEAIAAYASALAAWKRDERERELEQRRTEEAVDEDELDELERRGVSTDPADYEGVPSSGAYVTIKETKPGYRYYYWQWRDGEEWLNEYIAPVQPKGTEKR